MDIYTNNCNFLIVFVLFLSKNEVSFAVMSRNSADPFSVVLVMSGRGRGPRTPPPGSCSRPWGWWGRPPGPGCWHCSCGAGWSSCRTPDGPQYLYFLFYTHSKNPFCTLLQLSEMKRSAPAPNMGPQLGWWDTANSFFLMSNLHTLGPEQDKDYYIGVDVYWDFFFMHQSFC